MSNARVLVVEDEGIVAKSIQSRLKRLGYAVPVIVSSGEEAIQKAEETRPDLVLMDIVLKGRMDGIRAAEEIYNRLNIPVVYLTAHSDSNTLERAKLTEPFGYVLKPFEAREIHSAIEMALHKHKTEKKLRQERCWLITTLRKIHDAVVVTDDRGFIKFMNPRAEFLIGRKIGDPVGKTLTKIFNVLDEETNGLIENSIRKIMAGDEVISSHNRITLDARDRSKNLFDLDIAPIQDKTGKITAVTLVFRNIKEIGRIKVKDGRPELTTGRGKEENIAISLMIATSSHMVREGIHNMLEPEQNIQVLANASGQSEIIPLVLQKKPDVLIIDTAIPELNVKEILESISETNTGTRVLLLLRVPDERLIVDSISMGVKGCLSGMLDRAQFIQAITTVSRNKIWVELEVVTKILTRLIHSKKGKPKLLSFYLTRREEDIARLVVEGYSNKKISRALLISEKTVKSHLRNVFKKLGVRSRSQLALEYHGLTRPNY